MPPIYPHRYEEGVCRDCGSPEPPAEYQNPEAICLGAPEQMANRLATIIRENGGKLTLWPANSGYWPGNEDDTGSSLGQRPILAVLGGPADTRLLLDGAELRSVGLRAMVIPGVLMAGFKADAQKGAMVRLWRRNDVVTVGRLGYFHGPSIVPFRPTPDDEDFPTIAVV